MSLIELSWTAKKILSEYINRLIILLDYAIFQTSDPRGSGFQGDAWRHAVYRQFGTVEVCQLGILAEILDFIFLECSRFFEPVQSLPQ